MTHLLRISILALALIVLAGVGWASDSTGLGAAPGLGPAPGMSSGTTAGGDLTGTYPNPTVVGISAGTAPLITNIGAITTQTAAISSTVTFNNSGVVFTGNIFNVVNTASAAGSKIADFQVGGVTKFQIAVTGQTTSQSTILTVGSSHQAYKDATPTIATAYGCVTPSGVSSSNANLDFYNGTAWSNVIHFNATSVVMNEPITVPGTTNPVLTTAAAITTGGASSSPTLGSGGPAGATTPTKWVPINDNGTTRYFPVW